MKNKMPGNFARNCLVVLASVVLMLSFAASVLVNPVDVGRSVGLPTGKVLGQNIDVQQGRGVTTMSFLQPNSQAEVNGNIFKDIVPRDVSGHPTFLQIDNTDGRIVGADFTSSQAGGTYDFQGTEISNPPNSRVIFNAEDGINMKVAGGGEIKEFPKSLGGGLTDYLTTIDGSRISLPGNFLMDGSLKYFKGRSYVSLLDGTSINDVLLTDRIANSESILKESDVFFDGKDHNATAVSFSAKSMIVASASDSGPIVKLKQDNPYMKINAGDLVAVQPSNSQIEISNRDGEKLIPKITSGGNSVIVEGSKSIEQKGGKVYLNVGSWAAATSSPAEIDVSSLKGNSAIKDSGIFVDNSKRIAIVPQKQILELASSGGVDAKSIARVKYNYEQQIFSRLWGRISNILRAYPSESPAFVAGVKG